MAKIGDTEISMDQFRVRYNEQLQQLSRQVGRPITPEQARAFGLEQQLLGRMVAFAVLDQKAKQMGLGISDAEIAKQITADPAFRGLNGQFDHTVFLQRIRDIGFTEPRFIAEQRQTMLRRQLGEAIGSDLIPTQDSDRGARLFPGRGAQYRIHHPGRQPCGGRGDSHTRAVGCLFRRA